jgi:hypothetical protein
MEGGQRLEHRRLAGARGTDQNNGGDHCVSIPT